MTDEVEILEEIFRKIFDYDDETYRYVMMYLAVPNHAGYLILHGDSSNGKSVLIGFDINSRDSPAVHVDTATNDVVCGLKPIWFKESEYKLKISIKQLSQIMREGGVKQRVVLATKHEPKIIYDALEDDIMYYRMKNTFVDIDHVGPNKYVKDETILNTLVDDPMYQKAYRDILFKYSKMFYDEYDGDFNNVPKDNIIRETVEFLEQ